MAKKEPRQSQRVNAEVPVRLENNAAGLTRDISPTGVYFVVADKVESGQQIRFSIQFEDPRGGPLHLDCVGNIVRVEDSGGKSGVAVAIIESRLARHDPDADPKEDLG